MISRKMRSQKVCIVCSPRSRARAENDIRSRFVQIPEVVHLFIHLSNYFLFILTHLFIYSVIP